MLIVPVSLFSKSVLEEESQPSRNRCGVFFKHACGYSLFYGWHLCHKTYSLIQNHHTGRPYEIYQPSSSLRLSVLDLSFC